MSSDTWPIGVVIPTLDCLPRLGGHLDQLREWSDQVEEIIVVDSYSRDGTVELLRQRLRHPLLSIASHPRGLYQSWNHGVAQLRARYTYISTVGDSITAAGLQHLLAAAESLACDVVISRPTFVGPQGKPVPQWTWPVHRLLSRQPLSQPTMLDPRDAFLISALNSPAGMLGSSASNLYRTATLHAHPFPTAFGNMGDTAWALQHAFDCRWGITPEAFSSFMIHPNAGRPVDAEAEALELRLDAVAKETVSSLAQRPGDAAHAPAMVEQLASLLEERSRLRACQRRYRAFRRSWWPWVLDPRAWMARRGRNRQRERLTTLTQGFLDEFHIPGQIKSAAAILAEAARA